MNRTLSIVVAILGVVMVILLAVVFVLVLQDFLSPESESVPTIASALDTPEPESSTEPESTTDPTSPPRVSQMPATFTPLPTVEATNTAEPTNPDPTDTPLPTNTLPPPTATNTPVPIILPTNTSPPPTNTPKPEPPAQDTRGLVAEYFNIQWERANLTVNGEIWFGFKVVNTVGYDVPYNMLGVMPKKDGQDRFEWFQWSYGGKDHVISPQGLEWEDHIELPESGNYTLRLSICFDGLDACKAGGGTWATLSQEIAVTIN